MPAAGTEIIAADIEMTAYAVVEVRVSDEVKAEGTDVKAEAMFSASAILVMKVVQPDKTALETFKLTGAIALSGASVTQIDQAPMLEAEAIMANVANMLHNSLPH